MAASLMNDSDYNVVGSAYSLKSFAGGEAMVEEGEGSPPHSMDTPYRYRIFPVREDLSTLSLSPITRSTNGSLRIHLQSSKSSLPTTRTDMSPDMIPRDRPVIIQTNLLYNCGITADIMGVHNSHPFTRPIPGKYMNVCDFGKATEHTFFDFARYLDNMLYHFVKNRDNYRFLTGYPMADDDEITPDMARRYLKRAYTTYSKTKYEKPSAACSFSFQIYLNLATSVPQLGVFHRSVPKSFNTLAELIALVPEGEKVKLILKPVIYLTDNYGGMDEAAKRFYRYECVPHYSLQVIYQVCTINVDIAATA
jgi:hypothetical protein